MKQKLQNIIFPSTDNLEMYPKLFYRGSECPLDMENQVLYMPELQTYDFTTYLNGCSYGKWKNYTNLKGVTLELDIQGTFDVNLVGYNMNDFTPIRVVFHRQHFDLPSREVIRLEYPENNQLRVGFEIITREKTTLFGGAYYGEYDESDVRDITLCVATTTCKKEEFIRGNMELIRKEILEDDDDMKNHFYVHVVDNGRTLDAEKESSWHMTVHPNKNVGGSGGYARGMIEALHNDPKATHVLLMDDDIQVLPESIKRTYRLLTLLKPEHNDDIISGAMMLYESPNIQHEDIGTVKSNCILNGLKGKYNQEFQYDNLVNELENYHYGAPDHYAAWWYCCIPIHMIEKNGLPLPIFIRCDDVEYGLRCKTNFLTMDGICVWHMGFVTKYNLAMDRYQMHRNYMIIQAVGTLPYRCDATDALMKGFRGEMLRFNYNGAEVVLRALQDFMKGPEFIKQDLGEKLLMENRKYNETFVPLSEFGDVAWDLTQVLDQPDRKFVDTWWYRLTYNGHRFWPSKWLKDERPFVYSNDYYQPQKYVRKKAMYVINIDTRMATLRQMDKKRWKALKKEWDKTWKEYKRRRPEIDKAYRDAFKELTSEEFWREYLEI